MGKHGKLTLIQKVAHGTPPTKIDNKEGLRKNTPQKK